jgi:hypothetical protein
LRYLSGFLEERLDELQEQLGIVEMRAVPGVLDKLPACPRRRVAPASPASCGRRLRSRLASETHTFIDAGEFATSIERRPAGALTVP